MIYGDSIDRIIDTYYLSRNVLPIHYLVGVGTQYNIMKFMIELRVIRYKNDYITHTYECLKFLDLINIPTYWFGMYNTPF